MQKTKLKTGIFLVALLLFYSTDLSAQVELMPWGNLTGIRIDGQLNEFATSLNVVKNFSEIQSTGKERQRPTFKRHGTTQVVTTMVSGVQFTETVTDKGWGLAEVTIRSEATEDRDIRGVYWGLRLPKSLYRNSTSIVTNALTSERELPEAGLKKIAGKGLMFAASGNKFSLMSKDTLTILTQTTDDKKDYLQFYFSLAEGTIAKGQVFQKTFTISVSGKADRAPAEIQLYDSVLGRPFAGLGGNFRLQHSKTMQQTDDRVIDYSLQNLRVSWGRVEMPWRQWQPDPERDPAKMADSGKADDYVLKSMQMAQKLGKMNIPVIVSAWFPPGWAVEGAMTDGPAENGIWGNPLNQSRMPQIYKSITDYLLYLKRNYNTEAAYFSFNESDLGINVRQTAEEHAQFIKGIGAYFVSKGLKTKLLLGDNSDANSYSFIYPALNDTAARQYIGAISFHSWRGWDRETLKEWADAATAINVPLLVGEGSIDAGAWRYPAYFLEESYALEEINLYTRLLTICQPVSILQWELTSDYSTLQGGGIFGDTGALVPTRRFWQLKQLADAKGDLFHIDAVCNRTDISCAALVRDNRYVIHIVNNSGARKLTIKGIRHGKNTMKVVLTDATHNMTRLSDVHVVAGQALLQLPARSYVTLE